MKTSKKCPVCGKSMSSGLLCEKCEKTVLEEHASGKVKLTLLTGIFLTGLAYILWTKYSNTTSEINLSNFNRFYDTVITIGKTIIGSPFLFVPVVIILLIIGLLFTTRLSK